jgi:hypothetical protein
MLKTVKKLFGFKVKETEEKVSISTLEHAKKEDHDRILAKARQERADRERRDRERMRTSDSGSDVYLSPYHPLNPIHNTFDDDSSSKHRKHDSGFSDGGSPTYHHTHGGDSGGHSPSSPSGGGGGDSGGGDGGGGGGD